MKGFTIAITTVIALILIVMVLVAIAGFFLLGLQMSPLEARKIFSSGCVVYCSQISDESLATGEKVEMVAVQFAENLKDSPFIKACNFLYPETNEYPYLCWNRDCCTFMVLAP